jgi:putative Ca2+/H+ antiporter (TMEM165/GDT1 family)
MLWRGGERTPQREVRAARGGAWAAFAMIFFTEWGDPGQLAAAALVAQYGQPVAVWVGGCSAMLAKGAVALTFGIWVRRFVKPRVMHAAALVVCVVLAITTTIEHWR